MPPIRLLLALPLCVAFFFVLYVLMYDTLSPIPTCPQSIYCYSAVAIALHVLCVWRVSERIIRPSIIRAGMNVCAGFSGSTNSLMAYCVRLEDTLLSPYTHTHTHTRGSIHTLQE